VPSSDRRGLVPFSSILALPKEEIHHEFPSPAVEAVLSLSEDDRRLLTLSRRTKFGQ
jgi:hypothetical protein